MILKFDQLRSQRTRVLIPQKLPMLTHSKENFFEFLFFKSWKLDPKNKIRLGKKPKIVFEATSVLSTQFYFCPNVWNQLIFSRFFIFFFWGPKINRKILRKDVHLMHERWKLYFQPENKGWFWGFLWVILGFFWHFSRDLLYEEKILALAFRSWSI